MKSALKNASSASQTSNLVTALPAPSMYPVLSVGEAGVPVATLLKIDPENIDDGLRVQAAWFATVTFQAARIENQIARQERHIKELEASHYKELLAGVSTKKPSEASIKAMITISEPVRRAHAKLFDLEDQLAGWKAVRDGMAQKKDMLVNLGASIRLDKKTNLVDVPG